MSDRQWTKRDEFVYVKSLLDGTVFDGTGHYLTLSKRELLINYLRSARRRIRWGTYIPGGEEICRFVEKQIRELPEW